MFNTKTLSAMLAPQDFQPMSSKQLELLLQLLALESKFADNPTVLQGQDFHQLMPTRMFWGRTAFYFGQENMPTPCLWIWLSSLTNSPGKFLLLLALVHGTHKGPGRVTLQQVASGVFANGVPSDDVLSTLWDLQKSDTGTNQLDNRLDNPAAWTDVGVKD